ncbi:MAG TPA: energy transducer TonB [Terriglobales bacterium]|nr:energy transducer TonB [Terriglobales bacterium]
MQASRGAFVNRTRPAARPPQFLVELEPWGWVFLRNLRDLFRPHREPMQMLTSRPAPFWPDVFVQAGIPRRPLLQSVLYHVFIVIALWGLSNTFVFRPRVVRDSFFRDQKITYYDVSEYLPAIDTGSEPAKEAKKGEPEYSPQRIVSLPKHPDNSTQTIIDPIDLRLITKEVKLPNMVVWTDVPAPPVAGRNLTKLSVPVLPTATPPPAPNPTRNLAQLTAPALDRTAVAPAPDPGDPNLKKLNLPAVAAPGAIAPAPDAAPRAMGDLNVGHSDIVVTNPALPMPEQRAANLLGGSGATAAFAGAAAAVPAAPSVEFSGGISAKAMGQFVALSVRPSPPAGPIEVPGGNRRGIFAATPEGKPGAAGTPDVAGGGGNGGGGGTGSGPGGPGHGGGNGGVPAGILIGGSPASSPAGAVVAAPPSAHPAVGGDALRRSLLAAAHAVADIARSTAPASTSTISGGLDAPSKIEDKIFGPKKYYSMILNMPNLTSAGGSWIIRFAELHQSEKAGDLTAPVAMSKVDPAYPMELMRKNVEGTVTLYAVIRADGTVADIKVLEGLDDRLDENAKAALSHWHFRPATKNGSAVDLEAVVFIPFKARKTAF